MPKLGKAQLPSGRARRSELSAARAHSPTAPPGHRVLHGTAGSGVSSGAPTNAARLARVSGAAAPELPHVTDTPLAIDAMSHEELTAAGHAFARDGVIVLPLFASGAVATAHAFSAALCAAIESAPEFKPGHGPRTSGKGVRPFERHTLGGFGGCNLSSVLHCDPARRLRVMYHRTMAKLAPYILRALAASEHERHANFQTTSVSAANPRTGAGDAGAGGAADATSASGVTIGGHRPYFKSLFDRPLVRDPSSSVSAESWHRDCCDDAATAARYGPDGSLGFRMGGWIALNKDQSFICAPGTASWRALRGGFDKLTPAEAATAQAHERTFTVRPGEFIVFDETTCHRVAPARKPPRPPRGSSAEAVRAHKAAAAQPMTRLFTACEINASPEHGAEPLFPLSLVKDGAYVPLKSGQHPGLYPMRYWTQFIHHVEAYASRLSEAMVTTRSRTTRSVNGVRLPNPVLKQHRVPKRTCPSMVEQGLPPPTYTAAELACFVGTPC